MQYSLASPQVVHAAREAVLGRGELGRIREGVQLIPVEEVVDALPGICYVLELPASSQPVPGEIVHFGAVGDTIDLSTFTRLEGRFVDCVMDLWAAGERNCLVQVQFGLLPGPKRLLRRYFTKEQVRQFSAIGDRLWKESNGVIVTSDQDLLEMLIRIGLREIAQIVLVFPKMGLAVCPYFDLRVLVIQGNDHVVDSQASAARHGLSLQPLSG